MTDEEEIEAFLDPEDWWKRANRETYRKLYDRLLTYGIPAAEALEMLRLARAAAADEYGD